MEVFLMPLVTTKEMFKKAYEGHYAIGAFNVNNMEIVQGITEAAKELNAPLILQCSAGARKYAKHQYLVHLVQAAIEDTGLPIALHLDHGADFETCKSCIDGGFTSVMFDGSHYSFKENIEKTKEVVEYAHAHGVVVEAELGQLAGIEDDVKVAAHEAHYTDPNEVEEFVKETGVDSLAIAIGTSHGAYKFTPDQCTRNEQGILVPLHFVSTFLKRLLNVFLTSQSFYMVLLPFLKISLKLSTKMAVICQMLLVFLKTNFAKLLPWLFAKSTSTPTFVLQ